MNKKIISGILASAVLGGFVLAKPAMANEGIVLMRGAGQSGSCFAASVFIDGSYRVLVTCRDLKVALSPEQNRYVVWQTADNGNVRRLGEIDNGKLQSSTDQKFTQLFMTAESDGYGSKPSATVLLTGYVQPINFDTGSVALAPSITAAPTPTPKKSANATPTVTPNKENITGQQPSAGIGGALSTVLKIALFGFGALLLIVGVFSFISRKRSL